MRGEEELPEGELGAATAPSGSAGTGGDDIKEEPRISAGSGRYLVAEPELLSMEFSLNGLAGVPLRIRQPLPNSIYQPSWANRKFSLEFGSPTAEFHVLLSIIFPVAFFLLSLSWDFTSLNIFILMFKYMVEDIEIDAFL